MSDTTVQFHELEERKKQWEDMKGRITGRTAQWVAEQQAKDNAQQAARRGIASMPVPLPPAAELEACIKQAPERWQGVVMAEVILQGRSVEEACAACAVVLYSSTTQELGRLGLKTASEILEQEYDLRRLKALEELQIIRAKSVQQSQVAFSPAGMERLKKEAEYMRTYIDRAANVINPSTVINTKDTIL